MTEAADRISPEYVRLSGEVADQVILDKLRQSFPSARIVHAFASTEAGLAFEVADGQAGFPAELVGQPGDGRARTVCQVRHHDVGSLAGESDGTRATDAARGTRYDGYFALEPS